MLTVSPHRKRQLLTIYLAHAEKQGRNYPLLKHPYERRCWQQFTHRFTVSELGYLERLRLHHARKIA